jgi:hypothetical protein
VNVDTLYEEAQIKDLKFFEWPRFINQKLVEYYHERRRMTRKGRMLIAAGEMPTATMSGYELIEDHFGSAPVAS